MVAPVEFTQGVVRLLAEFEAAAQADIPFEEEEGVHAWKVARESLLPGLQAVIEQAPRSECLAPLLLSATRCLHVEAVQALLDAGCPTSPREAATQKTPLHLVLESRSTYPGSLGQLQRDVKRDIVLKLLGHGADVTARDAENYTPVWIHITNRGEKEISLHLLQANCEWEEEHDGEKLYRQILRWCGPALQDAVRMQPSTPSTAIRTALRRYRAQTEGDAGQPVPLRSLLSSTALISDAEVLRIVPHGEGCAPRITEVSGLQIAEGVIKELLSCVNTAGKFNIKIKDVTALCDLVIEQLRLEGNRAVLQLRPPLKVFGDVHGQLSDLQRAFAAFGAPAYGPGGDLAVTDYLFLGDYVDRGPHDVAAVSLLFALKLMHPSHVHLLRGNHEDIDMNRSHGFLDNCVAMAGDVDGSAMHTAFNEVFSKLPLAALVEAVPTLDILHPADEEPPDNDSLYTQTPTTPPRVRDSGGMVAVQPRPVLPRFFCVHGGSATTKTIHELAAIKLPILTADKSRQRDCELLEDAVWSDPSMCSAVDSAENNAYHDVSGGSATGDAGSRGAGWQFGRANLEQFCSRNQLSGIIRAHEEVDEGVRLFWDHGLTVFSAPGYCNQHNLGGILQISADGSLHVRLLPPPPPPPPQQHLTGAEWLVVRALILVIIAIVVSLLSDAYIRDE